MALRAEALSEILIEPETGLKRSRTIVEFPRVLSEEELIQIRQENLTFIQEMSLEQDAETVEKAQRDMNLNPGKRLYDLYFAPKQTNGHLSITIEPEKDPFGKPIFRHEQTRYIP